MWARVPRAPQLCACSATASLCVRHLLRSAAQALLSRTVRRHRAALGDQQRGPAERGRGASHVIYNHLSGKRHALQEVAAFTAAVAVMVALGGIAGCSSSSVLETPQPPPTDKTVPRERLAATAIVIGGPGFSHTVGVAERELRRGVGSTGLTVDGVQIVSDDPVAMADAVNRASSLDAAVILLVFAGDTPLIDTLGQGVTQALHIAHERGKMVVTVNRHRPLAELATLSVSVDPSEVGRAAGRAAASCAAASKVRPEHVVVVAGGYVEASAVPRSTGVAEAVGGTPEFELFSAGSGDEGPSAARRIRARVRTARGPAIIVVASDAFADAGVVRAAKTRSGSLLVSMEITPLGAERLAKRQQCAAVDGALPLQLRQALNVMVALAEGDRATLDREAPVDDEGMRRVVLAPRVLEPSTLAQALASGAVSPFEVCDGREHGRRCLATHA